MSSVSITSARRRSKRVFYGWWVAVTGAFNMVVSSGPTFQASSVLFKAAQDEYGWSQTAATGVASFGRFGGALFGPLEGFLTDKFGPAKMVLFGFTLGGAGMILLAQVDSLVMYYVAFFVLSLGFSVGGFTPSMSAVNAWMPHRRATAMSFVVAGSSAGGFLAPALVWGIQNHGWRDTVTVMGIFTIIVGPFIAKVLAKRLPDPASMNRLIRRTTRKQRYAPKSEGPAHDFTPKEALKTRGFWAIAITHTLTNFSVAAISAHQFFQLTGDYGVALSDQAAASIMTLWTVVAFGSQLAGGAIGDRVEKRYTVTALALVQAGGLVTLALANNYGMAMLFAVLWGIGFGGRTPILHAMRGEFFGRKHFGTILGMSSVIMITGMTLSPIAVGWVFDQQGTYRNVLFVLAGAAVAASLTVLLAKRPDPPRPGLGRRVRTSQTSETGATAD